VSGLFGQIPVDITPEARSARSKLNEFYNTGSVQALQQVRESNTQGGAFGNMTEKEWPRIEDAFGSVRAAKDPEALLLAIKNARNQIAASRKVYEDNWKGIYGDVDIGYERAKYTPESSLYPRGKKTSPVSESRSIADRILEEERRGPR